MSFFAPTQAEILKQAMFRHAVVKGSEQVKPLPVAKPKVKIKKPKGCGRMSLIEISRTYLGLPITDKHKEIALRDICVTVCEHFGVSRIDFVSKRKPKHLVEPRMIAAYIGGKLTTKGASEIGRYMQRDHSTILHAQKKVRDRLAAGHPSTCELVAMLTKRINEKFGMPDEWPDSE